MKIQIEEIKEFLENNSLNLKKSYGVNQIGIGYKFKSGKRTDEIGIIFYVNKKESNDALKRKGIKLIPKKIDGIVTDIIEIHIGFETR